MRSGKRLALASLFAALAGTATAGDERLENDPAAMLYYHKPLSAQSGLINHSRLGMGIGVLQQYFEPGWFTPAGPYRLSHLLDFGIGRHGVEEFRVNDVIIWGSEIDISREEDPRIQPSQWAWVGIVAAVVFGASCAAGGFPCNSLMDGQTDLSQVGEDGFLFNTRPVVPAHYDRVKVE